MKIQLILGTQVPSTSRARMHAIAAECARQSGNFGEILTSRNLQVNPPTI